MAEGASDAVNLWPAVMRIARGEGSRSADPCRSKDTVQCRSRGGLASSRRLTGAGRLSLSAEPPAIGGSVSRAGL
jgi:hypothetical protein